MGTPQVLNQVLKRMIMGVLVIPNIIVGVTKIKKIAMKQDPQMYQGVANGDPPSPQPSPKKDDNGCIGDSQYNCGGYKNKKDCNEAGPSDVPGGCKWGPPKSSTKS